MHRHILIIQYGNFRLIMKWQIYHGLPIYQTFSTVEENFKRNFKILLNLKISDNRKYWKNVISTLAVTKIAHQADFNSWEKDGNAASLQKYGILMVTSTESYINLFFIKIRI